MPSWTPKDEPVPPPVRGIGEENAADLAATVRIIEPAAAPRGRALPLERRSTAELRALARERNIPGRSTMRKDELIAALRGRRRPA